MLNTPVTLRILLFLLLLSPTVAMGTAPPSYTFWYGTSPPIDLLSQFDRIIVEAGNLSTKEISQLKQHDGKVIAYLSLGETLADKGINPDWIIGQNTAWKSRVMDLSAPGWQQYILDNAARLITEGAQGFFLDTLDSYMLPESSPEATKKQQQGLIELISQLKKNHPKALLVANRGFEVIPEIAPALEAVAAESLYQGWNNTQNAYIPVKETDSNWLRTTLKNIQKDFGLDIVVLDYLPPEKRDEARKTAHRIEQDGFIPWIANPTFDYMGIGNIVAIPRKVLFIYDSVTEKPDLIEVNLHRLSAPVFEYMGYIPVYLDIRQGLPQEILKGRYAGIISWLVGPPSELDNYRQWLKEKIKETNPLVILGDLNLLFNQELLALLGLQSGPELDTRTLSLVKKSKLIGFETDEPGRLESILPIKIAPESSNTSHLKMGDSNGHQADMIVTGTWGGYADSAAILDEDFSFSASYIIDPFTFYSKALNLTPLPAPDVTTENGRRLLFTHIDGDGFMEKFETPGKGYAANILLEEIFKKYPLPHTVSIVEGEIGPTGLYPKLSKELEGIAKKIYSLDQVELASHSYSHPFKWDISSEEKKSKKYNLPIKGYTFDLKREIIGSVNYINRVLAPPEKEVAVFLWTGNCLPTQEAIDMVAKAGLLNMNGGDTIINASAPSLTNIVGMGKPFADDLYHTYAAIGNENVFTNDWTGPFYGYRRATETFELTDKPKRVKPINIYYHFYSGSKHASLKALQTVYDWAMAQETMPIFASEYIRKTLNYQHVGISRRSDGTWRVTGLKALKSLRLSKASGWPQPSKNNSIIGWRELHDGIYLHAGSDSVAEFKLGNKQATSLHLHQANGRVVKWQQQGAKVHFRINGNVPVLLEVAGGKNCSVQWNNKTLTPKKTEGGTSTFMFPVKDTGNARLECN